jgi:hypothetical protein
LLNNYCTPLASLPGLWKLPVLLWPQNNPECTGGCCLCWPSSTRLYSRSECPWGLPAWPYPGRVFHHPLLSIHPRWTRSFKIKVGLLPFTPDPQTLCG